MNMFNQVLAEFPRVGSRITEGLIEERAEDGHLPLKGYPWITAAPQHLVQAAELATRSPKALPSLGLRPLRERLADELQQDCGCPISPDMIVITAGAMSALHVSWLTILSPGDQVVVPTPTYFVEGSIRLAGGSFRPVAAVSSQGVDWDEVETAIEHETAALLLTNPNNPTGTVLEEADFDKLGRMLARAPRMWLVVDESYEKMLYDGRTHVTAWKRSDFQDRTLIIRSFSKSFALPWLRVGWLAAPQTAVQHVQKVTEWLQLFGSYLTQRVALAALEGDRTWLHGALEPFDTWRHFLFEQLSSIEGCELSLPAAGPFLYPDLGLIQRRNRYVVDQLLEAGLPITAGRYFGSPDSYVRIPFGADLPVLARAAEIIQDCCARTGA